MNIVFILFFQVEFYVYPLIFFHLHICVYMHVFFKSFMIHITLSTAMNLVQRNSFPKLSNLPQYFTRLGKFRGEANDEKHADPGKKQKQSAIT